MTVAKQNVYGKTLHADATSDQLNQMLHDCCLFATLKHSTINSPLGIVYREDLSPYPIIVYPYSCKGILKRFIINNRTSAREQVRTVFVEHEYNDKQRLFQFRCYRRKNSCTWLYTLPKVYIFFIVENS
jgi:hypothetical protein